MKRRLFNVAAAVSLLAFFSAIASTMVYARNDPALPQEARTSLTDAARCMNSVSLGYTTKYVPLVGRDAVVKDFFIDERVYDQYFATRRVDLFLRGHCFRSMNDSDLAWPDRRRHRQEWASDGTWYCSGSPDAYDVEMDRPAPRLYRTSLAYLAREKPSERVPEFQYVGICGFSMVTTPAEVLARKPVTSTILDTLDGDGAVRSIMTTTEKGATLLRVEAVVPDPRVLSAQQLDPEEVRRMAQGQPPDVQAMMLAFNERMRTRPAERVIVWYLDPARNHSLVRCEEFTPAGKMMSTTEYAEFMQLAEGKLWLPRRIVRSFYTDFYYINEFPSPVLRQELALVEASVSEKEVSSFSLNYDAPHTRIIEISDDGKATASEVPDAADATDKAPEGAQVTTRGAAQHVVLFGALLLCSAVLALAALLALVVKRGRARRNPVQ